jgi:hypothetical protein
MTPDTPPSPELIVYQLGEVRRVVEQGFRDIREQGVRTEERLAALELFRERVEERERASALAAGDTQANLVKAVLAALTILGTLLYIIANHGI